MICRRKLLALPLLGVLALLAGLAVPAAGQADNKKPNPQPPAPNKGKGRPGQGGKVQFEEAKALRQAFLQLAAANHDYDGHRVKAMGAIKQALGMLDGFVLKHGNRQLQEATRGGQAAIAQAEQAAGLSRPLNEPQAVSDAALRRAAAILGQVRPILVQRNQRNVLGQVDTARREIRIALGIR